MRLIIFTIAILQSATAFGEATQQNRNRRFQFRPPSASMNGNSISPTGIQSGDLIDKIEEQLFEIHKKQCAGKEDSKACIEFQARIGQTSKEIGTALRVQTSKLANIELYLEDINLRCDVYEKCQFSIKNIKELKKRMGIKMALKTIKAGRLGSFSPKIQMSPQDLKAQVEIAAKRNGVVDISNIEVRRNLTNGNTSIKTVGNLIGIDIESTARFNQREVIEDFTQALEEKGAVVSNYECSYCKDKGPSVEFVATVPNTDGKLKVFGEWHPQRQAKFTAVYSSEKLDAMVSGTPRGDIQISGYYHGHTKCSPGASFTRTAKGRNKYDGDVEVRCTTNW